jgi:hypothetical protein
VGPTYGVHRCMYISIRKSFLILICKVLSKSPYLRACVVSEAMLYFTSVILNTRNSTEILHSRSLAENALLVLTQSIV